LRQGREGAYQEESKATRANKKAASIAFWKLSFDYLVRFTITTITTYQKLVPIASSTSASHHRRMKTAQLPLLLLSGAS
jgi:hypothetical protein